MDGEVGQDAALYPGKISRTIQGYTIRSALGPMDTSLPLSLANFLLDHPDLCSFLVRRHKLAPYTIERRSPRQSAADDGNGTRGLITLTQRRDNGRVYFGEGFHESRLLPTIHASTVILMDVREEAGQECRRHITSSFDVYVRLKNPILSGFVKVLRPFVKGMVARIFAKAFLTADKVGRLMAEDPDGIAREMDLFPGISPGDRAVLAELMSLLKRNKASCARAR